MIRRAFTLIEMLLAVVLSAMLIAALLVVLGGVARDRRIIRTINSAQGHDALLTQLRWDLANARTMTQSDDGLSLTLVGHGAIDRRTLTPTGRLVSVTYRYTPGHSGALIREQECLDDPAQPQRWQETVAWDVTALSATPAGADPVAGGVAVLVPQRVRLRLETTGDVIDRELWLK